MRRLLGVAIGLAVVLGLATGCTDAREFSIDRIEVEADVRADGTMDVVERVTYTFTGADEQPFTVGVRTFEPGPFPWRLVTIAAFDEDGGPRPTLIDPSGRSEPTLFEWDIAPARSGTRTYELRYTIDGAVRVWADVAEVYWNWIGRTSPAVGEWSAVVDLPGTAGEVRAWAHGPLTGVVTVDGSTVRSTVADVPEGQFVDNRIVVPADAFTLPRAGEARLEAILAEEQALADEANRRRDDVRAAEDRRDRIAGFLSWAVAPILALAGVAFWSVWKRWGEDPRRPDDIGDYWREVPDDPPAVASALMAWNVVGPDAFSATLVDLARRGHLRIAAEPVARRFRSDTVEHHFERVPTPPPDDLTRAEQRLLDWFFADGPTISQSALVARSAASPSEAQGFWTGFKADVGADLRSRRYVETGKGPAFALHGLIVLAVAGVAVLSFANGAVIPGIAAGLAAVVLLPLGVLHRSRTPAGARRYHEWAALKRFLSDFSRLDEAPIGHLALWEHYLVAAMALGVSTELLDALETRFPELADPGSGFATWYVAGAGVNRLADVGAFASAVGSPAVSSFTPQSSGSGGGGGFSSGGGGGGGGGGFGAR